jgi:hypothetical protein
MPYGKQAKNQQHYDIWKISIGIYPLLPDEA